MQQIDVFEQFMSVNLLLLDANKSLGKFEYLTYLCNFKIYTLKYVHVRYSNDHWATVLLSLFSLP